jgi:hypothetical protein
MDADGNRELQGIPEGLVCGFSKRTGEIDAEPRRDRSALKAVTRGVSPVCLAGTASAAEAP